MRIEIESIKVAARIRKLTAKIDALAADIQKNGLINPITVMAVDGGYQLLAGLRRLRAAQSLGWMEIEATIAAPKDAEAALLIEHSENEQREAFTFSEKMDYARLIEAIERAKALERKSMGGKGGLDEDVIERAHLAKGKSRNIVGSKIGMSGPTYQRASYVADHAPGEMIEQLDNKEKSVNGAYRELRAADKPTSDGNTRAESASKDFPKPVESPSPAPETDLQRAIRAERELDAFKYRQHNEIYHRDSIIESLKNRVSELESALEAAHKRIRELEGESHGTATSL